MNADLAGIGERIRVARERAGLSQRDLQSRALMSQSTMHRLETGKRTNVALADFDKLAQALSIGLDELLYGSPVEARVLAAARTSGCTEDALRAALRQGIELLKLMTGSTLWCRTCGSKPPSGNPRSLLSAVPRSVARLPPSKREMH